VSGAGHCRANESCSRPPGARRSACHRSFQGPKPRKAFPERTKLCQVMRAQLEASPLGRIVDCDTIHPHAMFLHTTLAQPHTIDFGLRECSLAALSRDRHPSAQNGPLECVMLDKKIEFTEGSLQNTILEVRSLCIREPATEESPNVRSFGHRPRRACRARHSGEHCHSSCA